MDCAGGEIQRGVYCERINKIEAIQYFRKDFCWRIIQILDGRGNKEVVVYKSLYLCGLYLSMHFHNLLLRQGKECVNVVNSPEFSIVDIDIAPWTVGGDWSILKYYRNIKVGPPLHPHVLQ
mmetsp:Transcript_8526/g.20861  ORF Transcript_8526/g.20861 Transcript_8526/m.20861 type:complete len:121 (+) Transcript_8526:431-793(+)